MAYELYIWADDGAPTHAAEQIVAAFAKAGIPCAEQPDEFGHWLVLDGFESTLDLTIKNDLATGANFRFATEDDESVVEKVVDVFKGLGWAVSDAEGIL